MSELGTMVMPGYDNVITFKDEKYMNLPQVDKDIAMAHQMQHIENKEMLIKKAEKEMQQEKEEDKKDEAGKEKEEMEEELIDFQDSQDKQLE
jgi:hypothetical protein